MKYVLGWFVLLVVVPMSLVFCGPKAADVHVKTATVIASAVNGAMPVLRDIEKLEGNQAIDRAPDKATAKLWLVAIESSWQPVWDAQKALMVAEDVYATVIEKGGNQEAAYEVVEQSFCRLVPLVQKHVKLPPITGVVCPGVADAGSLDGPRSG